jgi:DNA-binding transcriptional LysR family regulator
MPAISCKSAYSRIGFAYSSTRPTARPRATCQEYLDAEHVTVAYEARRPLEFDRWLSEAGIVRRFVAYVPGFAGIAPFLRGTPRLATVPSLLRADLLRGLGSCDVPVDCPPLPMYMVWHLRYRHDPLHGWVREELEAVARQVLMQAAALP